MFAKITLLLTLFASTAFAIPSSGERLQARTTARRLLSWPKKALVSHPQFSSNWAGAIMSDVAGTFTNVSATITVPTPGIPAGAKGSHAASAWVGIDGDTCGGAILQTGLDFIVASDGTVSYDAWYEWYPEFASDFADIEFKAGDDVMLTVQSATTMTGTATIINLTTGKQVSKALTSTSALCQQDAEWIVEDFEENEEPVPFANFDTVTFQDAQAIATTGVVRPAQKDTVLIEQNGAILTSATVNASDVTVTYKGSS